MNNGNLVVYSSILLITDVRIYINWVSRAYPLPYGLSRLASGRFLGKTRGDNELLQPSGLSDSVDRLVRLSYIGVY